MKTPLTGNYGKGKGAGRGMCKKLQQSRGLDLEKVKRTRKKELEEKGR